MTAKNYNHYDRVIASNDETTMTGWIAHSYVDEGKIIYTVQNEDGLTADFTEDQIIERYTPRVEASINNRHE